ncbi:SUPERCENTIPEDE1 [Hibiscus trionum]|uniref:SUPERCENTIPEDE1 n=1 Tax=Hibiscus trionum TaxID=183268 RepID=A0A9W7MAL2_HIBTR|nr:SUPERCENTIPEDE1 [Hibiscus trionum]
MSLAVGEDSSSKSMGFDKDGTVDSEASETKTAPKMPPNGGGVEGHHPGFSRKASEASFCPTEDEDDDDDEEREIELGPKCTLKEQLEKDKDDESLRRWKEQLLGTVDFESVGEKLEPDVKILSLAIKSPGRPDMVLTIPENGKPKGSWFTLKEGSKYSLKFTFQVSNNIVSGLKYTNMVWKTGVKVDSMKEMMGTFSPQAEPYTHEISEETTPSGMFARGSYSARSKFVDDDNKCYLEINYGFDIRKEWQS